MYKQLFIGGNMNSYSNLNSDIYNGVDIYYGVNNGVSSPANSLNHNNTQYGGYYSTMDLCSQAQMAENSDNILSRMDKLRAFAREQQAKRMKPQRQQTSFCF
jgi:hypothetical protein